MGLGEMMGVKNVKLELKGNYATLADLLEAMKDIQFEAGVPELTKHGIGAVIVFPPVDRNNQVWITGAKGKFTIMRSAEAWNWWTLLPKKSKKQEFEPVYRGVVSTTEIPRSIRYTMPVNGRYWI